VPSKSPGYILFRINNFMFLYKPLEIIGDKMYAETGWCIHQNPVIAGFVYEAGEWVYSSAKGYAKNGGH
jgi:hypothetical protein